ncbi:MAG: helix-hairpin-helix domain-containing protein [Nitrospirales bacterium]
MAGTQHWGEWSLGKSLLVKIGILGMGIAVVWWVGWPQPQLRHHDRPPLPRVLQQATAIQASPPSLNREPEESMRTPSQLEGKKGEEERFPAEDRTPLIDLNLGSRMELERLPGIGMILADRIVSYRSLHGNFQHVQDLGKVVGIGKKRLKQLEPFVTVKSEAAERAS